VEVIDISWEISWQSLPVCVNFVHNCLFLIQFIICLVVDNILANKVTEVILLKLVDKIELGRVDKPINRSARFPQLLEGSILHEYRRGFECINQLLAELD